MDYEAGDVVVVPFPFTDRTAEKRRPALVLSSSYRFGLASGHCLMAMITSSRQSAWPLDYSISDPAAAGLHTECVVRMKLFTLDARLILRKAGVLADEDMAAVRSATAQLLG